MAQVYSVNVVGYVNVTVPAGKLMLLANPLNNADNKLSTVMPLPESADGATIFRFDPVTQAYKTSSFLGGVGWLGDEADPTVAPGEGFFFLAPAGADVNLTFVGEVPQGTLSLPLAGNGLLTLVGSVVPQEGRLGDLVQANTMSFPAADGDTIFSWDNATQNYKTASYLEGLGWVQDDGNTAGPLIPVANGFWVLKPAGSAAVNWVRTFTVQ